MESEPCVPGEEELDLKSKDEEEEADDEEEKVEVLQPKREHRRREGLIKELIIISVCISYFFVNSIFTLKLNSLVERKIFPRCLQNYGTRRPKSKLERKKKKLSKRNTNYTKPKKNSGIKARELLR